MSHPVQEVSKHTADGIAALATVGTLAEMLPPFAALFTIVWTGIRIYDWVKNKWFLKKGDK